MKRLCVLLLAAAMLLPSAGCAALFDRELYTEEPYEAAAEAAEPEEDAADSISSYAGLRRAIARLVSEHADSAELQFQNYDGSISQDISTACWEVKSTAMGAFAVDYISFDLSRIVSYYQAEIHITYKKSERQVSALEQTENMTALRERLDKAIRGGEAYLVLGMTAASVTAEDVRNAAAEAYYADPLSCPVLPAAEAVVYPETGVDRIIEITLDYGMSAAALRERRRELTDAAAEMAAAARLGASSSAPGEAELLAGLCRYLTDNCTYGETAGGTAWDALTAGAADSEGLAMALKAGCQALGIPCRVVFGRLNARPHVWDLVTLGDGVYHVDVSNDRGDDRIVFLAGDAEMWSAYWWDTSDYPESPAAYASGEPSGNRPSGEAPAGTEAPEETAVPTSSPAPAERPGKS